MSTSTFTISELMEKLADLLTSKIQQGYKRDRMLFVSPYINGVEFREKTADAEKGKSEKQSQKDRQRIAIQSIAGNICPEVRNQLSKLLKDNRIQEFYTLAVSILGKAEKTPQIGFALTQCENQLKNLETRRTLPDESENRSERAEIDITQVLSSEGTPLESLVLQHLRKKVALTLDETAYWAGMTVAQATVVLEKGFWKAKTLHEDVLAKIRNAQDIKHEELCLLAIASNIEALRLIRRAKDWDALEDTLDRIKSDFKLRAEETDFRDTVKVHVWQALGESVIPQMDGLKARHLNAQDTLSLTVKKAFGAKRDLLSQQAGRGGSKYNELTAIEMARILSQAGLTSLAEIGIESELDSMGFALLGCPNWIQEAVRLYYFTDDPVLAGIWQRIKSLLIQANIVSVPDVLRQAASEVAQPKRSELFETALATAYSSFISDVNAYYWWLQSNGVAAERAHSVLCAWIEMSFLFNDDPLSPKSALLRLANFEQPATLLYIGCLRHSYAGGVHSIKSQLRDKEWVFEFFKVLRVLDHYRIPYRVMVSPSDLEILYTKFYPPEHPNSQAAAVYMVYMKELKTVSRYETILLTEAFSQRGLMEFYDCFYRLFFRRIQLAHLVSQSEAWVGWFHVSVQQFLEKEWLALASKERGKTREEAPDWGFRQIAKSMAAGLTLSAWDEKEPLIVFVTGRRPSAEIEVKGSRAVNGNQLGYIFLSIPPKEQEEG